MLPSRRGLVKGNARLAWDSCEVEVQGQTPGVWGYVSQLMLPSFQKIFWVSETQETPHILVSLQ